ncbi:siderophore iron transporter mirB [Bimuria novae-zelandiae CBS 107.79]|uniref:Siderophore iron transporter mirB n=1 Tax=Bimuria novae-zelandiae CBS 107.79 TaxID=1447943 RepID=A0A6A5V4K9_9PLEO|nr:siderophore iron transporter mirB [Bimuria novae-zelandiae CBS 107.79]
MGFSFKGLTSAALVSKDERGNSAVEKDIADVPASVAGHTSEESRRNVDEKLGVPRSDNEISDDDSSLNKIDTTAEAGVQRAQAMTLVWTKSEIIFGYVNVWLLAFILAFTSGSVSLLTPYVTSSFALHSLTALTGVISSLVSGIWKLPYAKVMNIWGRPFALAIGVTSTVMGLIMMAACKNVQTYCAAMTFFYMGYNMIDFSITIFVADTSKLRNRAFYIAFVASPWLITTWVYSPAMDRVLAPGGIGFRWGFGIFAIVIPVVAAPLLFLFFKTQKKARAQGLFPEEPSRGSFLQALKYYLIEFDVVGLLVLATGLALFLLSFNLYSYQADQWKSPMIICFIIFGFLLIVAFGLWEKYGAPVTFIPWHLLKNRTVIFTYTMAFSLYTGWYVWDTYLYSMLVVVFNQPVTYAGYINNTYTMGSCTCSLIYGLALRYYGKLKVYSFTLGVPLTILGVGLMIHFRQPDENIGYIVMCLIFIAFGGGILVISEQTTLMTVSKQQDYPALLATESMIISVGSAIGSTIAGAIWTGVFPERLMANLPADAMNDFASIYGDIDVQSSYPIGSPTRNAINLSYGQAQRYMLIAAVCIYSTTWVSVALWQNVDVRKQKQRTVGLL